MTVRKVSTILRQNLRLSKNYLPVPEKATQVTSNVGNRSVRNALNIRYVDVGGGQDCANELLAAFGPDYDLEQYGVRLVASPRHADVLLVTGCVTKKMADPLRKTYEAIPNPKIVVACGDAAITGGVFAIAKYCLGPVSTVVPVDLAVPGDPPSAATLVEVFRQISGRYKR